MESSFNFEAPQYLESILEAANLADQDDGADTFFDTTTSLHLKTSKTPSKFEDFYTPYKDLKEFQITNENDRENQLIVENLNERPMKKPRRNKNLIRGENLFDGILVPKLIDNEKDHSMITRQDKILKTPTIELRSRSVIRMNRKRKASQRDDICLKKKCESKYMTLAEKILHFQADTPPRFKTRRIPFEDKENRNVPSRPTIPQSPHLMTKLRVRNENVKMEDDKKFDFKATKINQKIFEKPNNNDRPKPKSPTKPKPFALTEFIKKEVPPNFEFNSKPVTSKHEDTVNSPIKSNLSRKKQPKTIKPLLEEENTYSGILCTNKFNQSTKIIPFSFDERDKEMLKKREEKLKMLKEEMTKVPKFKAKPMPHSSSNLSMASSISLFSETASNISTTSTATNFTFKAKFPSVLYKEPFRPQKLEKTITTPANIELNTEKRAIERQQFEQTLKMKEERLELERNEVIAFLEKKDKEDIRELRKKLVHKARPVPEYPDLSLESYLIK